MEQVHGVDTTRCRTSLFKSRDLDLTLAAEKFIKNSPPNKISSPALPRQIPGASPRTHSTASADTTPNGQANGNIQASTPPNSFNARTRTSRSGSIDRQGPIGAPLQRRNSWFSNISAKFSSSSPPTSPTVNSPPPQSPTIQSEPIPPKITPTKNAVLQHGAKPEGTGPYTPAPPKGGQAAGFLGVFRRLSTSSAGALGPGAKHGHGLVDRVVLNVDQKRERCPISELRTAKLRRVAFCVDVEIAPMPRYSSEGEIQKVKSIDKPQKKKLSEKGEGDALKNPKALEEQKEIDGVVKSTGELLPKEPEKEGSNNKNNDDIGKVEKEIPANGATPNVDDKDKENTKKKDKKKKSEEERKARKEKKRRLAEANGSIPMEIRYDSSDSSCDTPPGVMTPKMSSYPTTNPVRIYRRCCQLRETPILKKITEQLGDSSNYSSSSDMVSKLDLTGYWLQLPDLVTLGDYLAVVPVREVLLENSGVSDEGLRVILAGLLAAKRPVSKRRKLKQEEDDQGGVVERLILKNNKLGPDGWKHLSLFVYLCRSLKFLDISRVPFPKQPQASQNGVQLPRSVSDIFSRALGDRLGGSTLELVNMGETEPSMEQLGTVLDGLIRCGVKRLGLAHNHVGSEGLPHVIRYLAAGKCEGLDLGGNDLGDHMEELASSIKEDAPLWAISLAGCNLTPSSLCKIFPTLVKLGNLRFIDLSHNHALFQSTPSAVGLLRRYLPKMVALKRIHLEDVQMTAEQAIALVEVLPEIHALAHINLHGNPELMELANAKTEEAQEEACALYASLLAAARVSKSLICVDIEVPGEGSGEIVKAMAKQVVAYCLRNMERLPDADINAAVASALAEKGDEGHDTNTPPYPDVLVHLVGHDVFDEDESVDDDSAPDEDYVIGGTGVVKALTCCLKNRGDESRRQSGEFIRDVENGVVSSGHTLPTGGKAKDMSKHLLVSARKIRHRLQPALSKAQHNPGDEQNLRKLMFLDDTLQGIIKRFEDEYPDTRAPTHATRPRASTKSQIEEMPAIVVPTEDPGILSDNEDESEVNGGKPLSRSNSMLSKTLAEEEGRILRAGHRFRVGFLKQEQIDLLSVLDDIGSDPRHMRMLGELAEDIGGELLVKVKEVGPIRAFKENKDMAFRCMAESDPDHWERFVEAQQKAQANTKFPMGIIKTGEIQPADESAIAD
ncbi:hypothetical protein G7046_g7343 [Stylonectria norvegica]|nr:hypothetical protein G7046_g7343 [Stylonectria norvegica]